MGKYVRPLKRATTILGLLGANSAFSTLYNKHMRSPIACILANNSNNPELVNPSTLYTPENVKGWDFDELTIDTDPILRVIKRDLISFVRPPVKNPLFFVLAY